MVDRDTGSLSPGALQLPPDDEVPSSSSTPARSGLLTDTEIRAAKPAAKPYKLWDRWGLFLLVTPATPRRPQGSKLWRYKYTLDGKENMHALGRYPDVSLATAREKLAKARELVAGKKDPNAHNQMQRRAREAEARGTTVREIGDIVFATPVSDGPPLEKVGSLEIRDGKPRKPQGWAERGRLVKYLYPSLGGRPIKTVVAQDVERILDKLVASTKVETARRLHQHCVRLWKYAVKKHHCAHNVIAEIDPIPAPKGRHLPSIEEPRRYGELLRALEGYGKRAELGTKYLLRVLPHLCLRSSEIRWARWSWVNFERAEMRIPAKVMKLPSIHIIPLSTQVLALLRELCAWIGSSDDEFIFPGLRFGRPLCENTVNTALTILGFKREMCGHGVRSFFSTQLHEHQWPHAAIEIQIAHIKHRTKTEGAYDYSKHLPMRRVMSNRVGMDAWAGAD